MLQSSAYVRVATGRMSAPFRSPVKARQQEVRQQRRQPPANARGHPASVTLPGTGGSVSAPGSPRPGFPLSTSARHGSLRRRSIPGPGARPSADLRAHTAVRLAPPVVRSGPAGSAMPTIPVGITSWVLLTPLVLPALYRMLHRGGRRSRHEAEQGAAGPLDFPARAAFPARADSTRTRRDSNCDETRGSRPHAHCAGGGG